MIKERVCEILKEIGSEVKLVIAVKYASPQQIREIIETETDIGFNTLQQFKEVKEKFDLSIIQVHFIGYIQSNKIKKIVELKPYLIQSVSSFEIAEKINSVCESLNVKQKILLQINTDFEKKNGFSIEELRNELLRIKNLKNLEICGLMTIPPEIEKIGEEKLCAVYEKMKEEYEKLQEIFKLHFDFLSMGMSEDYKLAIKKGANMVRIGRKIFE